MSATQAHPNLPPPKPDHSFTEKPSSALGQFFWRRRMWFEATFVLSMLEPWEKILLRKSAQNIMKLSGATLADLLGAGQ